MKKDYDSPEEVEKRKNQENPIIMYLIVRESLSMSPGKIAAQCAHASQMLILKYVELCDQIRLGKGWNTEQDSMNFEVMRDWLQSSFRKVVLKADDKEWHKVKLTFVEGVMCFTVIDAGLTEIVSGSETVIGLWPMYKSEVPKVIKKLQTLK